MNGVPLFASAPLTATPAERARGRWQQQGSRCSGRTHVGQHDAASAQALRYLTLLCVQLYILHNTAASGRQASYSKRAERLVD
jgi:hypothetical protein